MEDNQDENFSMKRSEEQMIIESSINDILSVSDFTKRLVFLM